MDPYAARTGSQRRQFLENGYQRDERGPFESLQVATEGTRVAPMSINEAGKALLVDGGHRCRDFLPFRAHLGPVLGMLWFTWAPYGANILDWAVLLEISEAMKPEIGVETALVHGDIWPPFRVKRHRPSAPCTPRREWGSIRLKKRAFVTS